MRKLREEASTQKYVLISLGRNKVKETLVDGT
jgi:hypothetical protein